MDPAFCIFGGEEKAVDLVSDLRREKKEAVIFYQSLLVAVHDRVCKDRRAHLLRVGLLLTGLGDKPGVAAEESFAD